MPAAASVHPDAILKELGKLWIDLGKENPETGVLRACAMTFIVVAAEEDDPQVFGESVGELTHANPSRVIVLRVCCPADARTGDARLESRVYAQCWKPFGSRQQICSEIIEISASPEYFPDVPQIILGLTVPDLPIVLWSRDPDFINSSNVDGLLAMADKVIVDSTRIPDPEQGLLYVKNLLAAGINVGDLAWTRMSPWRQSVAQIFEDAGRPALQKVRITYYKQSPSVSGRYLAAWFREVVPGITVSLERAQDPKRRSIFLEAAGLHASVEVEGSTAYSTVNGLTRESAVPDRNDAALLREELAILGQDATFRKLIQSAQ